MSYMLWIMRPIEGEMIPDISYLRPVLIPNDEYNMEEEKMPGEGRSEGEEASSDTHYKKPASLNGCWRLYCKNVSQNQKHSQLLKLVLVQETIPYR